MRQSLRRALIAVAAVSAVGAAGLVVAQETPPTAPAEAAKSGLARDYSIGTLPPSEAATPQAEPDDPPTAAAAANATAKPVEPIRRPRYGSAILQAVDKVTAETLRFEAKVGEPIRFKGLVVTINTCETTASDEDTPDSVAHMQVLSQPEGMATVSAREAYRGWMYANAAAVHPFQHPVYDLWLIACKAQAPSAAIGMR
jgi:hypothetical protein